MSDKTVEMSDNIIYCIVYFALYFDSKFGSKKANELTNGLIRTSNPDTPY